MGRVTVALGRRIPQPTAAWDGAVALGRALLLVHQDTSLCHVRVHANATEAVRWRFGPRAEVAVHWALLPHLDGMLELLAGNRAAWPALAQELPVRQYAGDPSGDVHDLMALMAPERARLPAVGEVTVAWGRRSRRGSRRSLRLGSCLPGDRPFIRIHPVLDHALVPDWFVGFVLFHELLHILFPPTAGCTRRILHPKALRAAERAHPRYAEAVAWEQAHLQWLLSAAAG